MWKSEKSRPSHAPSEASDLGDPGDVAVAERTGSLRGANGNMLEELRGQPGFGVVVAAGELQPTSPQPSSIGQRMSGELEALNRRERQVQEMKELASHRVVDLTTDQLRRILEFMM